MKPRPFIHDPQDTSPQYLEDLVTGYWYSELLFTAVELDVFTILAEGSLTAPELASRLGLDHLAAERFLRALCSLGLLCLCGDSYCNTGIAGKYLVRGKDRYQGDSILWRKYLTSGWRQLRECLQEGGRVSYLEGDGDAELQERVRRYIRAMDNVARTKVEEILPLFSGVFQEGEILDVGAGSGGMAAGFLERFPGLRGTLVDLPHVLPITREMIQQRRCGDRVTFQEANILEPWTQPEGHFNLVILSNIIHAYSEQEIPGILEQAAKTLSPEGFLLVHDFFPEHCREKAALFDLNMFINTYNGRTFPAGWVVEQLNRNGLQATDLIPLPSDTAVIIASRDRAALERLHLSPVDRLINRIRALGLHRAVPLPADDVQVADWVPQRCRYGCEHHGNPHCPPHSPEPEKTRLILRDFSLALLLEGEPPTRNFQRLVLEAERAAFRAGYYKAFAFWAGPCSLCQECAPDGKCRHTRDARPSMESAGIDVYATARRAGLSLRPLSGPDDYVRYFALLLLE